MERSSRWKGLHVLVDALPRLRELVPDVRLDVVGGNRLLVLRRLRVFLRRVERAAGETEHESRGEDRNDVVHERSLVAVFDAAPPLVFVCCFGNRLRRSSISRLSFPRYSAPTARPTSGAADR